MECIEGDVEKSGQGRETAGDSWRERGEVSGGVEINQTTTDGLNVIIEVGQARNEFIKTIASVNFIGTELVYKLIFRINYLSPSRVIGTLLDMGLEISIVTEILLGKKTLRLNIIMYLYFI